MSKEIYISSTPHETRLAIVENEALAEIYYERENEYTLAGSIYNGRVTRVLPGMQSSFVDIGLERDAFLYITDFLEETPDAEEFDTAPSGHRNGERQEAGREGGGRGRGRRRGRGDRAERNGEPRGPGQGHATEGEFGETSYNEPANAGFGAGEGQIAGGDAHVEASQEGGRRWGGRRGRRRGRGNRGEQEGASQSSPEAGREGDFAGESVTDFNASAERSFEEMARPDFQSGNREQRDGGSGGRDHGRRDRDREGGRYDSRREGSREEGHREGSERRSPRGFEPRSSRYGAGDERSGTAPVDGAYDTPPAGDEIFVLPGESLARHRPAGEQAEAHASANAAGSIPSVAANANMTTLAPPATLYTLAEGWDGGAVMPGETIRPRGLASRSAEPERFERATEYRGRDRRREGSRRGRDNRENRPRFDDRHTHSDEFAGVHTPTVPEAEAAPNTGPPVHDFAGAGTDFAGVRADVPHVETEYEPTDASASYRVDPVPPSEFRQSAPVVEEEVMEEEDGTHDVTSISAAGEMHSEVVEELTAQRPQVHEADADAQTDPIRHEGAVITPFDDESAATVAPTLQASSIEEMDDLDEESLEHAADLGTMLREMSIDQITRTQPEIEDEDGDDDDFEEDLLEEDELDEEDDEDDEDDETESSEHAGGEFAPEAVISDAFERVEPGEESYEVIEGGADFAEGEEDSAKPYGGGQEQNASRNSERRNRDFGREPDRRRGRRGDRDHRDRNHDRGRGRMGHGDRRSRNSAQTTNLPAISDLLKPGQEVLVQIAKEPIAKKGARITSHIALPGRFLVFMPTVNHTGVSRKIESDGERRRLKEILLSEKGDASGGFIVRTAAEGASEEELRNDLRFLLNLWADIKARSEGSKSPALIYHDLNLVERVLRDQVTDNFSAIWVDTEAEYERVLRFLQRFQPSLIRRVKLYLKETPLFEQFGITEEINKALRSKVWLKSGGSIVINQTEALVAIDINTGKYVGKTARLEDTIVKTNLDAIPEIVRQIRLRDLGGIIIIDFIDMDERKNRNKVMAALEEELKNDRAPSKVLQFNDFGLVAITRKRVKQSLERTLSTTCNICTGTGMVKSPVTVCNDIYVELRKMHKHLERGDIMLRVHPEVVKQLKNTGSKWLHEMEEMAGKTILVKSDPSLHPEQFDIH